MAFDKPYDIDPSPTGDTVKESVGKNEGNIDDIYDNLNFLLEAVEITPLDGPAILAALLDVDGSGSMLDADLLDGRHGVDFAPADHSHDLATQSVPGFMAAQDKQKLDGIQPGAENNVQSDWNEASNSSDSFIRNKPNILKLVGLSESGDTAVFSSSTEVGGKNPEEMKQLLDFYASTDFIETSAGVTDGGKPIVLDSNGQVHVSMIPAVPAQAIWGAITGTLSNQTDLQDALDLKSDTSHNHDGSYEAPLGNPANDGEVLASTAAGVRSWVPMSGGGGTVDWGDIGGTLSAQTDLQAALDAKSDTGHNHDGSYFLETEHISTSAGAGDGGKPIILNASGQIDPSMLDVSTFYYVGTWDPSAGNEYPPTTGETYGAFWVVQDLTADYTFTGGDLSGKTISNGDFMVWAANGWSIMAGEMNPMLYYKLDGSQPLTDPFQAGDNQLKAIADGTDDQDAVSKVQLDTGLLGKSDTSHNHDSDYLAIDGKAADSTLFDGSAKSSFELSLGNPANDGEILSSTAAGVRSWIPAPAGGGDPDWGDIGGTLSNQTDLQDALDEKANTSHDHVMGDISDLAFPVESVNGKTGALTLNASDVGALPSNGKAVDSDQLDGMNSSEFATSGHNHDGTYLPVDGKAADSTLFDGRAVTSFAPKATVSTDPPSGGSDGDVWYQI